MISIRDQSPKASERIARVLFENRRSVWASIVEGGALLPPNAPKAAKPKDPRDDKDAMLDPDVQFL